MRIKQKLFLGAAAVLMTAMISVGANAGSLAEIQEAAGTIRRSEERRVGKEC